MDKSASELIKKIEEMTAMELIATHRKLEDQRRIIEAQLASKKLYWSNTLGWVTIPSDDDLNK